uniref:Uncharacterized protein n=1 Tax=Siphoviridae sp. ctNYt19 TaxID=2825472 RepID=A0A8S5QKX3_9CAUD|nr:MAG TPA: Protein of unknown function (DUF3789) [Siphoviridae sp. ctNYt19]DAY42982.1 MAG TPA: Protein of unknown function (DUF3789) [Caudoviricetes sp.]
MMMVAILSFTCGVFFGVFIMVATRIAGVDDHD